MKKLNIQVEYIYHSGFTIETEDKFLIFDYYKGDIQLKNKKTYVFVSHGHGDHYNPEVLQWDKNVEDIQYILSKDIDLKNSQENIHTLSPYETLNLDDIQIRTFGSTDLGLSILVNINGLNIFHAGDLNWWHWSGDPEEENQKMEIAFKKEIEKIKGIKINLAFFPVDPRLGEHYFLGGEYFINKIKPQYFIPMHFGDKSSVTTEFIHKVMDSPSNIVEISTTNQKIQL